jgi:O-antigen ligase
LATLFNPETLNESSLQYRYIEDSYALPVIASHPLIGLGLGAEYRPWDPRIDYIRSTTYDQLTFIHNGHLWIMLKTGLIGYIFLLWLLFRFLIRGIKNWKYIYDPFYSGIVLSFAVICVGIMIVAFINNVFYETYWAPVIGIMMGVNEVILKLRLDTSSQLLGLEKSN